MITEFNGKDYTTVNQLYEALKACGGNLSGVYKITRINDNKTYIGQSKVIADRIKQHINNIREDNSEKIDGALQKDGWQNFSYTIILALPELTDEQLWLAESDNIATYDSYNTGFNKTTGNHIGKYDHAEFAKKNIVSVNMTKQIRDKFKLELANKKVLIINLFDSKFIDMLEYNNCIVNNIYKYSNNDNEIGNHIMEELKNYMNTKFDLIIANPPYGDIGDKITKQIIDTIDFNEFINLLPLKDYSLETGRHINFKNICTFAPHSFSNADILTHAVEISKNSDWTIKDETELLARAFTVDKPMIKFMVANAQAKHYAIDGIHGWKETDIVNNCFVFHEFRCKSQHTCGMDLLDTISVGNEYNFSNKEIKTKTPGISGTLFGAYYVIPFNTSTEKINFVNFYKANRNFINRMIANQFIAIRNYSVCFPKVDWSKPDWTVEKILKKVANYNDLEVKAVLDTMDKDYTIKTDDSIKELFGEYL